MISLNVASIQFFKRKMSQPPVCLCHTVQAIARYGIFLSGVLSLNASCHFEPACVSWKASDFR